MLWHLFWYVLAVRVLQRMKIRKTASVFCLEQHKTKTKNYNKKTDMLSEKTNPFYRDARFWLAATSIGALALLALINYPAP